MDIRNVSNNGSVERSGDRPKRAESKRTESAPEALRDQANISPTGRETAAAVEGLAERARQSDGDREARVSAAQRKLLNGDLDAADAVSATARKLLDSKFFTI